MIDPTRTQTFLGLSHVPPSRTSGRNARGAGTGDAPLARASRYVGGYMASLKNNKLNFLAFRHYCVARMRRITIEDHSSLMTDYYKLPWEVLLKKADTGQG